MAGWIHLHPVSQTKVEIGWKERDEKDTVIILPSLRQMRFLPRQGNGFRLMTFDAFVRTCLPDSPRRFMTPAEQQWVVQKAMAHAHDRQPLSCFKAWVDGETGWIGMVEQAIGELKRSGVTPSRLLRVWRDRPKKFQELAHIYEAYQHLLKEYALLDQEEAYFEALRQLPRSAARLPERLVLQHFHGLNRLQELFLLELVTQVEIHIHLMFDETRERLNRSITPLVRRLLHRGFQAVPVNRQTEAAFLRKKPLVYLVEHAFSEVPHPIDADGCVEVVAAPGKEEEVDQVVARLKKWLLTEQARSSDAAIIMADFDEYAPLLYKKLDEAGIPVWTEYKRRLADHPLMQTVAAVFSVRVGQKEWIPGLLHSTYLPWLAQEREMCLKLMRRLNHPTSAHELKIRWDRSEKRKEEQNAFQALLEWFSWIEAIPEKQSWPDWVRWLSNWIKPLKRVEAWREAATRHDHITDLAFDIQGWHGLAQLIKEWTRLAAQVKEGRPMRLKRFFDLLMEGAARQEVRVRPGQLRGVHLLEAKQFFLEPFRAVFLVGLAEGTWPRTFADHWLLPDRERAFLRREEIVMDYSWELRERQLVPFLMSVASATDLLVLSYPHTDEEGKRLLASPYLEECLRVFHPVIKREWDLSRDVQPDAWEWCFSKAKGWGLAIRQLACSVAPHEEETNKAAGFIRRFGADDLEGFQLIDRIQAVRMRQKHFFTIYDGMAEDPRLRNILAGMLEKWVWSAHSLNRLVTCRFQFLVTGLWQVAKEDQSGRGFRRGEEGEWIHEILCRFFHEQREGKWNFRDETLELVRLNEIADEVLRTRLDAQEGEERDPFYVQMETKRLKQKLAAFWGHEKRWRTEKRFFSAPSYLELSFGLPVDFEAVSKGLVDPWSTPEPVTLTFHDGTKLKLKGKIDRVDQDEEEFYAVYDYKTGSTSRVSNEDIKAGKELQPFLYLKALIQGFGYDPAKAIGGGFYTKGSRAGAKDHRNKGLWRKEEMARIAVTTTKALDRMEWEETQKRIERLIAEQLRLVQQGNFAVDPTWNCPEFCPARQLCRVDTWSKTDNRQAREKEGDKG